MLGDLAAIRQQQGRFSDSEVLVKRALAIQEKSFGPKWDVASSMDRLANLYLREGHLAEAAPLYE